MDTYGTLNELLVKLFNDILTIEEKALITEEFKDLTINDMHVIENIGIVEIQNMSTIAAKLKVTVGTLTISINNLVKKGYVDRRRSDEDRRVVLVSLTDKGRAAYHHHLAFHDEMIQAVMNELADDEMKSLTKGLTTLMKYFKNKA